MTNIKDLSGRKLELVTEGSSIPIGVRVKGGTVQVAWTPERNEPVLKVGDIVKIDGHDMKFISIGYSAFVNHMRVGSLIPVES